MKKYLLCCGMLLTLAGCSPILKPFFDLEGTWQRKTKNGFAYESWDIATSKMMRGKGFKISGNDTTVLENLRLFLKNGKIIYEATVPNQNDGKAVPFTLKKSDKANRTFVFENPKHDFPQFITYRFVGQDSLYVRVEADMNGERQGQGFNFRKVKP